MATNANEGRFAHLQLPAFLPNTRAFIALYLVTTHTANISNSIVSEAQWQGVGVMDQALHSDDAISSWSEPRIYLDYVIILSHIAPIHIHNSTENISTTNEVHHSKLSYSDHGLFTDLSHGGEATIRASSAGEALDKTPLL